MGIVLVLFVTFLSCKEESKTQVLDSTSQTEVIKEFSETEKREIVTFYLINGRKLAEKDFHEIIFLKDAIDNVKVIHYEGRDSFFTFQFSEALDFYTANKK